MHASLSGHWLCQPCADVALALTCKEISFRPDHLKHMSIPADPGFLSVKATGSIAQFLSLDLTEPGPGTGNQRPQTSQNQDPNRRTQAPDLTEPGPEPENPGSRPHRTRTRTGEPRLQTSQNQDLNRRTQAPDLTELGPEPENPGSRPHRTRP
ncbi:hypothetical protein NHX12_008337 [Muraenolepis orangiensis]|uniref:Uncharacterized protein n=1 Tax=Muraenolepis orangiensis TaxID=630683 RepID=A0A9Q0DMP1_9TELE|nr:hypothetical protein NHX12_008337 [Muraenolepis orangiensis]